MSDSTIVLRQNPPVSDPVHSTATALAVMLSALAMTAIVARRHLLSSGAFALATRLRHPGLYRGRAAQMRRVGWEMFPRALVHGPAGRWLITAMHHPRHHAVYRGNYGLYFRFWDKACGTDIGLGDLPSARLGPRA